MMYKLILVASAVNADNDHPDTLQLLNTACSFLKLLPGAVSTGVEGAANKWGPIHFSPGDLADTDTMANTACNSLKNGETFSEALKDQIYTFENDVFPGVAGKAAGKATSFFMGKDSILATQAGELIGQLAVNHTLGSKVEMALQFVTFIDTADKDKNTHMGFADILAKDEAEKMSALVGTLKGELRKAVDAGQTTFDCESELYTDLQKVVKNGLYDELLSKVNATVQLKDGTFGKIAANLATRAAVSKVVQFSDCKKERRILLA